MAASSWVCRKQVTSGAPDLPHKASLGTGAKCPLSQLVGSPRGMSGRGRSAIVGFAYASGIRWHCSFSILDCPSRHFFYIRGVIMRIGRWSVMYCHAPFPPKPKWRIFRDLRDKGLYIDLGRVRFYRWPRKRPSLICENIRTHPAHTHIHYDIDKNIYEKVSCPGNVLTVD